MRERRSSFPVLGVDLVEFSRARSLLNAAGPRLRRILSRAEWDAVRRAPRPERVLAEILAAKEAVFKAQGSPWMGPDGFGRVRVKPGRVSFKRTGRYVVATCAGT